MNDDIRLIIIDHIPPAVPYLMPLTQISDICRHRYCVAYIYIYQTGILWLLYCTEVARHSKWDIAMIKINFLWEIGNNFWEPIYTWKADTSHCSINITFVGLRIRCAHLLYNQLVNHIARDSDITAQCFDTLKTFFSTLVPLHDNPRFVV